MNYHNITKDDMLNGTGLRVVLWVAGCSHKCPDCQNPQTHDPDSGLPFTEETKKELFEALDKDYIEGITFSGGDPLYIKNRQTVKYLMQEIKEKFPSKNIWCYTGYEYEKVKDLDIMQYIDVLVDGKFINKLKDNKLHWKGSSNQRVINIQESRKQDKIVLLDE